MATIDNKTTENIMRSQINPEIEGIPILRKVTARTKSEEIPTDTISTGSSRQPEAAAASPEQDAPGSQTENQEFSTVVEQEAVDSSNEQYNTSEVSDEDKAKALDVLKSTRLIDDFLDVCGTVYMGRKKELLLLKLATISRFFDRGVSIIVNGTSSVGKTALVATVLKTVDENVLFSVTRITSQYLLYLPESLDHKIIYFRETPGLKDAIYPLRTALTEGWLDLGTVQSMGAGGRTSVENRKSTTGLVMLSTTTDTKIDYELGTRILLIEIRHDEELARLTYLQKATGIKPAEDVFRTWQIADSILEPHEVFIPYMEMIAKVFPTDDERYNRDFDRMQSLIKASALWHQYQRERDSTGRIIATEEDYKIVYSLKDLISEAMDHAPANILKFLFVAKKMGRPTREEVRKELSVSEATIKRYVRQCALGEFIMTTGRGKRQTIEVVDIPSPITPLPSPDRLFSLSSERLSGSSNALEFKDKNGSLGFVPVIESNNLTENGLT